jgi:hypothetical protein
MRNFWNPLDTLTGSGPVWGRIMRLLAEVCKELSEKARKLPVLCGSALITDSFFMLRGAARCAWLWQTASALRGF